MGTSHWQGKDQAWWMLARRFGPVFKMKSDQPRRCGGRLIAESLDGRCATAGASVY
jgi:hypothetical protein